MPIGPVDDADMLLFVGVAVAVVVVVVVAVPEPLARVASQLMRL